VRAVDAHAQERETVYLWQTPGRRPHHIGMPHYRHYQIPFPSCEFYFT
jgi:hypothetical protein